MAISRKLRAFVLAGLALGAIVAALLPSAERAVAQGSPGVQITSLAGTEQITPQYPCTVSCFFTTATLKAWVNTFSGSTGATTIASGGCGTTTNGTVAGTNQSGIITIGAAATTTCTVNFSATLSAAPKACTFSPGNAAAAATGTTVAYLAGLTTAHFVITGSALANTVYNYACSFS